MDVGLTPGVRLDNCGVRFVGYTHAVTDEPVPQPTQGDRWLGRRIGNYSIVHKLGAGGMGIVYEAEQASLGRRIALKVLPRTPATQPM